MLTYLTAGVLGLSLGLHPELCLADQLHLSIPLYTTDTAGHVTTGKHNFCIL